MKYTKQYTGPKAEVMKDALVDAMEYLGPYRYRKLTKIMRDLCESDGPKALAKWWPWYTGMTGLQGAPARAIALNTLRYAVKRSKTEITMKESHYVRVEKPQYQMTDWGRTIGPIFLAEEEIQN